MKLGEFRKKTKDLSDDFDISIFHWEGHGDPVSHIIQNSHIKGNEISICIKLGQWAPNWDEDMKNVNKYQ